jgi:HTH-type transcriptional regulator/antitoxin HigA
MAVSATATANPVEMIERGAPRIIHNDSELAQYTEALFNLSALESPASSQQEAIELLTLLVERYEEKQYAVPVAGAVSMFLAGKRKLTLKQVQNLSARFKLPADIFIS